MSAAPQNPQQWATGPPARAAGLRASWTPAEGDDALPQCVRDVRAPPSGIGNVGQRNPLRAPEDRRRSSSVPQRGPVAEEMKLGRSNNANPLYAPDMHPIYPPQESRAMLDSPIARTIQPDPSPMMDAQSRHRPSPQYSGQEGQNAVHYDHNLRHNPGTFYHQQPGVVHVAPAALAPGGPDSENYSKKLEKELKDNAKEVNGLIRAMRSVDAQDGVAEHAKSYALGNFMFLMVIAGIEIDFVGFSCTLTTYWNYGYTVLRVFLFFELFSYVMPIVMFKCRGSGTHSGGANNDDDVESGHGWNDDDHHRSLFRSAKKGVNAKLSALGKKGQGLQLYHVLPGFRFYVLIKQCIDKSDVESLFKVNTLSSFTLGVYQLLGIAFTFTLVEAADEVGDSTSLVGNGSSTDFSSNMTQITDASSGTSSLFVYVNVASQILNWCITLMYFATPIADWMANMAAVKQTATVYDELNLALSKQITAQAMAALMMADKSEFEADRAMRSQQAEYRNIQKSMANLVKQLYWQSGKALISPPGSDDGSIAPTDSRVDIDDLLENFRPQDLIRVLELLRVKAVWCIGSKK